ncbi:MAG: DUF6295 family protein [Acidimicrobiales bacterium]
MCTYATELATVSGSAKWPGGTWFHFSRAAVYFDHPVHAMADHTLNIDLADPGGGPSARVALELSTESALELAGAIRRALAGVPAGALSPPLP